VSVAKRVDLNRYTTVFGSVGINTRSLLHSFNWALKPSGLSKSLLGDRVQEQVDLIDKKLIGFVNHVDDSEVEKFHRDQFMSFRRYQPTSDWAGESISTYKVL